MIETLFYPVYLLIGFIFTLIFIPQIDYKHYAIYGILIGGLGDMVVVGIFQNGFHIIWFKNAGVFNVLGQNFLSPLSWTVTVMLFLRFLPTERAFQYLYILTFGLLSVGYGLLVRNVGLFDFLAWYYPVFAFLTFAGWWSFAAWLFLRTSPLAKSNNRA